MSASADGRTVVDVTNVVEATAWLRAEIGRPGTPLETVGPCERCDTLCWTTPTGERHCLKPAGLSAIVEKYYWVVALKRGRYEREFFPTSATSRVLRERGGR